MKQASFLLVVDDIAASRTFYEHVLQQAVLLDFGAKRMTSMHFLHI